MTAHELNDINREIGGLRQAVDTLTKQWRQQEDIASEGRRQLYNKFDTLKDEVRTMESRVTQMGNEIKIIQPSIQAYNEKRLRDEGARQYGSVIWGAILTAAGLTGWAISTFVHWMFGKTPL